MVGGGDKANAGMKYIFDSDSFGLWVFSAAKAGAHLRGSMYFRRMNSTRVRAATLLGGEGIIIDADAVFTGLGANAYVALSGFQGDMEVEDWPPAVDYEFVSTLEIASNLSTYDDFLRGHATYLRLFMAQGTELNRNSLESMLVGTQALARTYRTNFGSHWLRCLDSTEDFLRASEASYSISFLVHTFDNALGKFSQLARDDYRRVDSTYPVDLKTPGNLVALFKAVFKKMESAVNHAAFGKFNADQTVHPGAKKSPGLSAAPVKRLKSISSPAPEDLYCATHLQHVLGLASSKECTKKPCPRTHPRLQDLSQKVARASIGHIPDPSSRKELVDAIHHPQP